MSGQILSGGSARINATEADSGLGLVRANTLNIAGQNWSNVGGTLEAQQIGMRLSGNLLNQAHSGSTAQAAVIHAMAATDASANPALNLTIAGVFDNTGSVTQSGANSVVNVGSFVKIRMGLKPANGYRVSHKYDSLLVLLHLR